MPKTTFVDLAAIEAEMRRQSAQFTEALRAFEAAGEPTLRVSQETLRDLQEAVARFCREHTDNHVRFGIRA